MTSARLGASRILTELNLHRTPVSDIRPLEKLTKLNRVILSQTKVRDLSPLEHMTRLTYLDLYATPVDGVAPLMHLHDLAYLRSCVHKCKQCRAAF